MAPRLFRPLRWKGLFIWFFGVVEQSIVKERLRMTVELSRFAIKVLQGDMMTPISVYQSLTGKHKMLFESSAKHEESGR